MFDKNFLYKLEMTVNSTLELKYKMIYISVQVLKNVKSNDVIYCVSHISCSDVYDTIYGLLI